MVEDIYMMFILPFSISKLNEVHSLQVLHSLQEKKEAEGARRRVGILGSDL